jgi:hypothetical protein
MSSAEHGAVCFGFSRGTCASLRSSISKPKRPAAYQKFECERPVQNKTQDPVFVSGRNRDEFKCLAVKRHQPQYGGCQGIQDHVQHGRGKKGARGRQILPGLPADEYQRQQPGPHPEQWPMGDIGMVMDASAVDEWKYSMSISGMMLPVIAAIMMPGGWRQRRRASRPRMYPDGRWAISITRSLDASTFHLFVAPSLPGFAEIAQLQGLCKSRLILAGNPDR